MKTVGILGGFGPETTAVFQLAVIDILRSQTVNPPILMWNTPIPKDLETDLILHGEKIDRFLPFLIDGAERLERAGADFIVIPCNTLHALHRELVRHVRIPILHIGEEVAKKLQQNGVKSIMIWATNTTINSRIHEDTLRKVGIETITPLEKQQKNVDNLIHQILRQADTSNSIQLVKQMLRENKQPKCHDILLACTDLQLVFHELKGFNIHDTMSILAQATAQKMLE